MDANDRRRAVENEIRYRAINEKIESAIARAGIIDDAQHLFEMLCECASAECREMIEITLAEYERVRADDQRFVIRPHHEEPQVETVMRRTPRFWEVSKPVLAENGRG